MDCVFEVFFEMSLKTVWVIETSEGNFSLKFQYKLDTNKDLHNYKDNQLRDFEP